MRARIEEAQSAVDEDLFHDTLVKFNWWSSVLDTYFALFLNWDVLKWSETARCTLTSKKSAKWCDIKPCIPQEIKIIFYRKINILILLFKEKI